MAETVQKRRPQFRNIHVTQIVQYRLPIAGIMSILHRISGAAMFVMLPAMVWLFDLSLTSELSYAQLTEVTDFVIVKHPWHIGLDFETTKRMRSFFAS